ncbi:hypothetical protein HPL003_06565 [Paenibacillus terrae HPL-003]|uniref:Uncharacterized protein n=1 Tax=Paenibacillus terrae (strain HPL-003) TaxID=985665 RepID=G7W3I9_PAETH|nr:hypothetical protein HPL003_06565 [Paenibacillus terrae HPL-003]
MVRRAAYGMSETDPLPLFLEGEEGELWHFIMKAFLTAD